jgi:hypothetical protein
VAAKMKPKEKWPVSVPVFTADMIVKQTYTSTVSTQECHCALGWLGEVFAGYDAAFASFLGGRSTPNFAHACRTLAGLVGIPTREIAAWNDRTPRPDVARVLNETCRRLGYTEIIDA